MNLTLLPNTQQSVQRMSVTVEEKQTSHCVDLNATADVNKRSEHDAFPFSVFTYFLRSSTGSLTSFCILHRWQMNSFKQQLTGWKPVTVIICQCGGKLACQTWIVRIKWWSFFLVNDVKYNSHPNHILNFTLQYSVFAVHDLKERKLLFFKRNFISLVGLIILFCFISPQSFVKNRYFFEFNLQVVASTWEPLQHKSLLW